MATVARDCNGYQGGDRDVMRRGKSETGEGVSYIFAIVCDLVIPSLSHPSLIVSSAGPTSILI